MPENNRIIVSVTNDLVTDQRLHKVCSSLHNAGYHVSLVGRQMKHSPSLTPRIYSTHRLKLLFYSGPLFYLNYNLALLWFLFTNKADVFLSNDLDTLPANFVASKLKRKPLVYDSHEYFTEVPELVHRKRVRQIWETMEAFMLPKVDAAYTVSAPIAEAYEKKYGISMSLIRNFPLYKKQEKSAPKTNHLIIYQGAVNVHRGIEQMIEAMQWIDNAEFWIVGGGDLDKKVRELIDLKELSEKVIVVGRKPFEELGELTRQATIGVSLEEQIGLNYTFALPNKVFDYIHAGVPVLASTLPEVEIIFGKYNIGLMIDKVEPRAIAEKVNEMLNSGKLEEWKVECEKAAMEYNWQNEETKLLEIFKNL